MTLAAEVLRYWHTLRHLKPVQLYGRVWFKLYQRRLNTAAAVPGMRARQGSWQAPAGGAASMLGPVHFRLLNQEHILAARGGWNEPAMGKLWLYNLHYFDDLNAAQADRRAAWHRALVQRWVADNPPSLGNGWEPYPTSRRIVNWVKWALAGNSLPAPCVQSLALQARWLAKRVEWHLLGNHLFANAKALVFAGLFFNGDEARKWMAKGIRIITLQLPEQVLQDGGNFERSPMYHAIFLEDLLDLVNAATVWPMLVPAPVLTSWREAAIRMLAWLEGMTHPDGQIALFNDACFGNSPLPEALRAYAQRLGIAASNPAAVDTLALLHWPDSGYVRLFSDRAVAFLDVAPVGPDYLPGHAHADTLSFEMSVFGQRVVVNGGTSRYGLGPERLAERETAAHSTVAVAGQSSSEVWGGFRVARRAYPVDLRVQADPAQLHVACSHTGYARLTGKPLHRRTWEMNARGLQVTDTVWGGRHAAVARYILHPHVSLVACGANAWRLVLPGGQAVGISVLAGAGHLEPARYAPEFGMVLATQCLAVDLVSGEARVAWTWS